MCQDYLNVLSNELFDVHCNFIIVKDLSDDLAGSYMIKDEGTKKFAARNFSHCQMTDEKSITSHIHEFHNIMAKLAKKGDSLPESFEQNKTFMSFQQIIINIKIEEMNMSLKNANKAKEVVSKANIVEEKST